MFSSKTPGVATSIGRGLVAGAAGTVVMTAFQKLIEMPITQRGDSYAPAEAIEKLTSVETHTAEEKKRLNYIGHLGFGLAWGLAYGLVASKGIRGQKAVHAVFAVLWPLDNLGGVVSGMYHPSTWSKQDWLVDLIDKYVHIQATGAVFDNLLDRKR